MNASQSSHRREVGQPCGPLPTFPFSALFLVAVVWAWSIKRRSASASLFSTEVASASLGRTVHDSSVGISNPNSRTDWPPTLKTP